MSSDPGRACWLAGVVAGLAALATVLSAPTPSPPRGDAPPPRGDARPVGERPDRGPPAHDPEETADRPRESTNPRDGSGDGAGVDPPAPEVTPVVSELEAAQSDFACVVAAAMRLLGSSDALPPPPDVESAHGPR